MKNISTGKWKLPIWKLRKSGVIKLIGKYTGDKE